MTNQSDPVAKIDLDGLSLGGSHILGKVRFGVLPGETVAVLGPSGIGKTSLLRVVAGLETRFEGHRHVTPSLAFVFQEPTLLPWRNVLENVTIPTRCTDNAAGNRLAEVGLADHINLFPGQLSLGQQRRLSLARAFATTPDLLLMDEPFVSLDDALADEVLGVFEALRSEHGTTTLLVTHAHAEAERLADRIITLGGSPATIQSEQTY